MKKLSTDFIIISLAILFIFGSVFLVFSLIARENAQEEAVQIRQEQDQIALYLVNNYEGIEKIEFTSAKADPLIGSRDFVATINNLYIISIDVSMQSGDMFVTEHISRSGGHELPLKDSPTEFEEANVEIHYIGE